MTAETEKPASIWYNIAGAVHDDLAKVATDDPAWDITKESFLAQFDRLATEAHYLIQPDTMVIEVSPASGLRSPMLP